MQAKISVLVQEALAEDDRGETVDLQDLAKELGISLGEPVAPLWQSLWPTLPSDAGWWWFYGTSRINRGDGVHPREAPCELVWSEGKIECYHLIDETWMRPSDYQGQWLRIPTPALPKDFPDAPTTLRTPEIRVARERPIR